MGNSTEPTVAEPEVVETTETSPVETKEVSSVLLDRAVRIVTGKHRGYTEQFAGISTKDVTDELIVELAEARIVEDVERELKGQIWYLEDLLRFQKRYETDKKAVLKSEYEKLEMSESIQEAVQNDDDPFDSVSALMPD